MDTVVEFGYFRHLGEKRSDQVCAVGKVHLTISLFENLPVLSQLSDLQLERSLAMNQWHWNRPKYFQIRKLSERGV